MSTAAPRDEQDPELAMPQQFGHYLLIEQVGSGGMAEVFKAVVFGTEGFRRVLVVKRIREELSKSPDFVRMFTDEARITALLDHPNIVQVYDFGHVSGRYFLAMEHLDGKDLASVMRVLRPAGLSLRPSLVARICLPVARGLHYAHMLCDGDGRPCRIVHRDINPANIMLLRTGGVKILDFGIAKASAIVGKVQTTHAKLKGKLGYLSPEQAKGEALDGTSDVFSLGIMMWEMLTGHRLFSAKTDFERIRNVLHAPIDAPSSRRSAVPPELDRIVMRALERDRSRRYGSAQEMADDLDEFLRTRKPRADAIRHLLGELFGAEPSVSGDRPTPDPGAPNAMMTSGFSGRVRRTMTGAVTGAAMLTASHSTASGGMVESNIISGAARPRPRAFHWVVGAVLLVAGVGTLSALLHTGGGARPAPFPMAQPEGLTAPRADEVSGFGNEELPAKLPAAHVDDAQAVPEPSPEAAAPEPAPVWHKAAKRVPRRR